MKKLMSIVGVVSVGALLYVHQQRGGQWTLRSLGQTVRDILGEAKQKGLELKNRAEQRAVHDVAQNLADATARQPVH